MASRRSKSKPYVKYHNDGTLWAKGDTVNGVMSGYREWFRKDGSRMRSGQFEKSEQVGEWTTYERKGKVHKVAVMRATSGRSSTQRREP